MTKVGRPQRSLSFKSQTIFLEHKIFIRVMIEIQKCYLYRVIVNELEIYSLHLTLTTIRAYRYVYSRKSSSGLFFTYICPVDWITVIK